MQKTVFFLDIDGPIASQRSILAGMKADPVAVAVVNELFSQPNIEVVLSSTFRGACHSAEDAIAKLDKKYQIKVVNFHKEWKTGASLGSDKYGRSLEIEAWLSKNRVEGVRYVALDDDHINIPDVIHIKADYNGIPALQLLKMRALYEERKEQDLLPYMEWMKNRIDPTDFSC